MGIIALIILLLMTAGLIISGYKLNK